MGRKKKSVTPGYVQVRSYVRTAPGKKTRNAPSGKSALNKRRTKFRSKLPKGVARKRQSPSTRRKLNAQATKRVADALLFAEAAGIKGTGLGQMTASELDIFKGQKKPKTVSRRIGGYKRAARARTRTPYQRFFAAQRRKGKSAKQIGRMWKAKKK